jgi:hypothetical protein
VGVGPRVPVTVAVMSGVTLAKRSGVCDGVIVGVGRGWLETYSARKPTQ